MPAEKRMVKRIELRLDNRSAEALAKLEATLGPDKTQSDIIREAIIEKANREAKRERARGEDKP